MGSYLHKDFHGALSVCMQHVDDQWGRDALVSYLRAIGRNTYKELIEAVRSRGLSAWEQHLREIFAAEDGDVSFRSNEKGFELRVNRCPALSYIRANDMHLHSDFCISTREVNAAIAEAADVHTRVEFDAEAGCCTQYFSENPL